MKPYSERADVYSYGVFLWEVYTRKLPHSDKGDYSIGMLAFIPKEEEENRLLNPFALTLSRTRTRVLLMVCSCGRFIRKLPHSDKDDYSIGSFACTHTPTVSMHPYLARAKMCIFSPHFPVLSAHQTSTLAFTFETVFLFFLFSCLFFFTYSHGRVVPRGATGDSA